MPDGTVLVMVGVIEVLMLAVMSAIVFRRLGFPYTIGLVLVGMLLAGAPARLRLVDPIRHIWLAPDAVLYLIVPLLVFPAAVHLDTRLLRRNLAPVLLLAGPGLLLSAAIVGGVMGALTPLSWGAAWVFGALISATDPVAVVALFKDLKVPGRLALLVDGESLLNDAVAIVVFALLRAAVEAGALGAPALAHGAASFIVVSLGGLGAGAALALAYARVVRLAEGDPVVEIALSLALAFTAFLVAEHLLHVSGIMAVVAAGLVAAARRRDRLDPESRAAVRHFWGYAEFAANSFVFLVLGVGGGAFVHRLLDGTAGVVVAIGYAVVAVLLGRLVAVYGLLGLSNRLGASEPIDRCHRAIIFWGGGLRGALPLVMALSLPPAFEHRQLILDLTAGIVLFTLLIQGTTVGRLLRVCPPA
jgi:CPA1 family monovalent cation:H+ antiporter